MTPSKVKVGLTASHALTAMRKNKKVFTVCLDKSDLKSKRTGQEICITMCP